MLRIFLFILLFISINATAQQAPKREFRAVWIATLSNLDWPSANHIGTDKQKQEFIDLLNRLKSIGINAVVVQVRPSADAFYESAIEPWSQWLCGTQGEAPKPYYDPLSFMIEECHHRNIEFHAWVNPYRAVSNFRSAEVHHQHITKRKPTWFFVYQNTKYFDPGHPEARQYITGVIADIATKYDIDGLHFDDYFYPYPEAGISLQDNSTFQKYGAPYFKNINDWRRNNVNQLIKNVRDTLNSINPRIKFGVSPCAVWRHSSLSAYGSPTKGGVCAYDELYADVRLWLEKGWIDYAAPQMYQHTKHSQIPYKTICKWWAENSFGRNIYAGMALYKYMNDDNKNWHNKNEISEQMRFNRSQSNIKGNILYRSTSIKNNKGKCADQLKNDFYQYPALLPTMTWKDSIPPIAPQNVKIVPFSYGNKIVWDDSPMATDAERAYQYVVYYFKKNETPDFNNPKNILEIVSAHKTEATHVFKRENTDDEPYQYYVTALDRLHNESRPASPFLPNEESLYVEIVKYDEIDTEYNKKPVHQDYPYTHEQVKYLYKIALKATQQFFDLPEPQTEQQPK